jgi:hypothetical protein
LLLTASLTTPTPLAPRGAPCPPTPHISQLLVLETLTLKTLLSNSTHSSTLISTFSHIFSTRHKTIPTLFHNTPKSLLLTQFHERITHLLHSLRTYTTNQRTILDFIPTIKPTIEVIAYAPPVTIDALSLSLSSSSSSLNPRHPDDARCTNAPPGHHTATQPPIPSYPYPNVSSSTTFNLEGHNIITSHI